jgi:ATP-dependent Zn protease
MYVALGAKSVRDLFSEANKRSSSIIFIDEIDDIGGCRNAEDET